MKAAYPIIMRQGQKFVVAEIPDFDIGTQGADYAEAMGMARDAIGLMGIDMEDEGEEIPAPSDFRGIETKYQDGIVTLVDVDFTEYRRQNDMRTVRRNVSLPSWLNAAAEKANLNVSAVLQAALKKELKVTE